MNKSFSVLKYLIGWPLSLVSLIFIFKLIYSHGVFLFQITNVNYLFLFLGIVFFIFYFILRGVTWHEIIKQKGNKLSFKKTLYFWEISEIKRYTPGNIWAFLSRSSLFTKDNLSNKDIASSLFNEILLIILGCFALSYFYISSILKNDNLSSLLLLITFFTVFLYTMGGKLGKNINLGTTIEKTKQIVLPGENYFRNFKLFLISTLSFLMFAIGTYFSSVAIFYIDPGNLTEILSLFVFSLLIGYLSFITPMGLGVREGTMTLGLSNFIPITSAGFIAIFVRIVFIISEIIFLILVFTWEKLENNFVSKIESFMVKHKYEIALLFFISIYIIYYVVASFLRYDNFYTGRFDLGNMDQAVWNSINGRLFQITDPNGTDIISRLSFHADFILVLISPLYLIWENPKMLLLLQTVVLGLGAVFVFLISTYLLKNKNVSLVFSSIYLINPAVGFTNLYDFHPVTLATTFLLGSFYFLLIRKYFIFMLFGVLSGLTKEHIWTTIALLGLTISFREIIENKFKLNSLSKIQLKNMFLGITVFILSISIFYYLIWTAIPMERGGNHFALEYYSQFGSSASEIAKNIILNPIKTFSIIFQKEQLSYLLQLLAPLGFLPFISPFILLFVASDLGINLLSNNPQLHQIYYQYSSTITPFLFISSIYSVYLIKKRFLKVNINILCMYLIITALIFAYQIGPLPISKNPNIDMFSKQLPDALEINKFLSSIPKESSVSTTNNLGSHLSRREKIYTIPIGIKDADYVLFLLNDWSAQPSLQEQKQMAKSLERNPNYLIIYKKGDFVAFAKKIN